MKFNRIFALTVAFLLIFTQVLFAGYSGGRSSFSGGSYSRSYSSPSRSYSSPSFSKSGGSYSGSRSIFGGGSKSSTNNSSKGSYSSKTGMSGGSSVFNYWSAPKSVKIPSYGGKTTVEKTYKLPSDFEVPSRQSFHYYGNDNNFMNFATTFMLLNALSQNEKSRENELEIARLKEQLAKDPKYKENMEKLQEEAKYKEQQASWDACFINTIN